MGFFHWVWQPSATDCGPYDYTRSGNPTRDVLERYGKPNLLSLRKLEVTAHFIVDTFSILYDYACTPVYAEALIQLSLCSLMCADS